MRHQLLHRQPRRQRHRHVSLRRPLHPHHQLHWTVVPGGAALQDLASLSGIHHFLYCIGTFMSSN